MILCPDQTYLPIGAEIYVFKQEKKINYRFIKNDLKFEQKCVIIFKQADDGRLHNLYVVKLQSFLSIHC